MSRAPKKPNKVTYKTIITLTTSELFDKEVNSHINNGWKLQGNPYAVDGHYCQAVIKYQYEEINHAV